MYMDCGFIIKSSYLNVINVFQLYMCVFECVNMYVCVNVLVCMWKYVCVYVCCLYPV